MALTYDNLAEHLPPSSIEFVGANQLKLNLSQLTERDDLSTVSPLLEGVAALLDGLAALTSAVNQQRTEAEPSLTPIVFVGKQLVGTISEPIYRFTVDLKVNQAVFLDNLLDPTE
ncbi:MAG: hypothetical protein H7Z11_15690 [Verrucomicrobia bacterium]|nr:hypothetical protein [Leptolyngbya sp. ES-bin-22]